MQDIPREGPDWVANIKDALNDFGTPRGDQKFTFQFLQICGPGPLRGPYGFKRVPHIRFKCLTIFIAKIKAFKTLQYFSIIIYTVMIVYFRLKHKTFVRI